MFLNNSPRFTDLVYRADDGEEKAPAAGLPVIFGPVAAIPDIHLRPKS